MSERAACHHTQARRAPQRRGHAHLQRSQHDCPHAIGTAVGSVLCLQRTLQRAHTAAHSLPTAGYTCHSWAGLVA